MSFNTGQEELIDAAIDKIMLVILQHENSDHGGSRCLSRCVPISKLAERLEFGSSDWVNAAAAWIEVEKKLDLPPMFGEYAVNIESARKLTDSVTKIINQHFDAESVEKLAESQLAETIAGLQAMLRAYSAVLAIKKLPEVLSLLKDQL